MIILRRYLGHRVIGFYTDRRGRRRPITARQRWMKILKTPRQVAPIRRRFPKLNKDTKTRLDGLRQIGEALASYNPIVNTTTAVKDIAVGTYKTVDPKGYRRHRKKLEPLI